MIVQIKVGQNIKLIQIYRYDFVYFTTIDSWMLKEGETVKNSPSEITINKLSTIFF